ncbi:hypothetical protein [Cerasicoccus arenae]|uniref:Asl1-like glycosyl hydrolase catalytic domain-containing protein n=1 Tax=Cerasicoccus arenae TaxID=424488 RepID=A0A8J3GBT4_9BACT|nr:hypothetical protein [Cerasicoccus arenae]MBK1856883.1 hypothetical protein [Cerasicoccus arenae]GHB89645.1 hypothetical protein GCM10007047_00080 [Cerasicoccus arenae]
MRFTLIALLTLPLCASADKPVFNDFMGLCVHTVQFKPELYEPVTRLVRDYHSVNWDLGEDTQASIDFPFSKNRVQWENLYGGWVKKGYEIDAALMFNNLPAEGWKNMPADAERYAEAFARYFGPSSRNLVTSAEIGNEPGHYSDEDYQQLFRAFATGLRHGDPKLKILTGNLRVGDSDKYAKKIDLLRGMSDLYDVLKVHTYAQVEGWPTWRRSYPEDPDIDFLSTVQEVIDWRNENASGKEVWVTEFGWDATTAPQEKTGTFKDWVGSTDTEQARYLVRAFLVFSAMDIQRAYIYFFNDSDKASVHAAAGLTRNFKPKPSFYAVSHLRATLGDYRFTRIREEESGELYVYEFQSSKNLKQYIWVAWSPTGTDREATVTLQTGSGKITRIERMPLSEDTVESVKWTTPRTGVTELRVTESPAYIFIEAP